MCCACIFDRKFITKKPQLTPLKATFINLVANGKNYYLIQILVMLGWGFDAVLVSLVSNPHDLLTILFCQKIFQAFSIIAFTAIQPLWVKLGHLNKLAKFADMKKLCVAALFIYCAFSFLYVLIAINFGGVIVRLLTSELISLSTYSIGSFAIWAFADQLNNLLSIVFNSANRIKQQLFYLVPAVALMLPTKILVLYFFGINQMFIISGLILLIASVSFARLNMKEIFRQD
jgi:hypothetical protein